MLETDIDMQHGYKRIVEVDEASQEGCALPNRELHPTKARRSVWLPRAVISVIGKERRYLEGRQP